MKKILHISKYYYPYLGGIEQIAYYLAEGLNEYENYVVCFNSEKGFRADDVHGIKVYRMSNDFYIASQSVSFQYYSKMKQILNDIKPDAVHIHCPNPFVYPIILSLVTKSCKVVLHWHSDIVKQKLTYSIIKPLESKILKRADLILVTSPEYLENSAPLAPFKEKCEILQNAIETSKLNPKDEDKDFISRIRKEYDNRPIIFFVGRHVEYKGLEYLLQASKYIKSECKIIIAGSGPLTEDLKKMDYARNKVEFIGKVSDDELRCYLNASKIFAFPSITKNEAFGVALAEAMYLRVVPVTFTIEGSGVNWVSINGETGIEVENGNCVKYAEAIDELLNNSELYSKYAEAARDRVLEIFTIEKMTVLANELYGKLFSEKSDDSFLG